MDWLMVVLKLVHVTGAVFWAGSLMCLTLFVLPAMQAAGRDGDRVFWKMGTVTGFLKIMPAGSGLTLLSGFVLYWLDSGHMNPEWLLSRTGLTYGIAALFGIAAGMTGGAITGRAANRLTDLLGVVEAAGGAPTAEQSAEIAATRDRLIAGAKLTGRFLGLALAGMICGRYVPF
jgi:hypothetical protein